MKDRLNYLTTTNVSTLSTWNDSVKKILLKTVGKFNINFNYLNRSIGFKLMILYLRVKRLSWHYDGTINPLASPLHPALSSKLTQVRDYSYLFFASTSVVLPSNGVRKGRVDKPRKDSLSESNYVVCTSPPPKKGGRKFLVSLVILYVRIYLSLFLSRS